MIDPKSNMFDLASRIMVDIIAGELESYSDKSKEAIIERFMIPLASLNLFTCLIPIAREELKTLVFADTVNRAFVMDLVVKFRLAYCSLSGETSRLHFYREDWEELCDALTTSLTFDETPDQFCSPLVEQGVTPTSYHESIKRLLRNNSWLVVVILIRMSFPLFAKEYSHKLATINPKAK